MASQAGRALVVEDALNWRRTLAMLLKRAGCQVHAAGTLAEGLDALDEGPFLIATVDVSLKPGDQADRGGLSFIREAWARKRVSCFLVVSGYAREEQVRSALDPAIPLLFLDKASGSLKGFNRALAELLAGCTPDYNTRSAVAAVRRFGLDRSERARKACEAAMARCRQGLFAAGGLCGGEPIEPASPNECFVAHEFSRGRRRALRPALRDALADTGFTPCTADEQVHPQHILCKVTAKILTTAFCIFDLPESQNPNVYLELGVAIALGRPLALVKRAGAELASLLEGIEYLGFTAYGDLRRDLAERIWVSPLWAAMPQEAVAETDTCFVAVDGREAASYRAAAEAALAAAKAGLEPVCLGQALHGPQLPLKQTVDQVQAARCGIYRIDYGASADTFLSLGIAIALNRPYLLIAPERARIPADLRGLQPKLTFEDFAGLATRLQARLATWP